MTDAARPVAIETLLTHRAWVRGLAWSLVRDAHLVDEVEQETWLRALRSPPREEAAARGWLATVVRNVVRNRFRTESRREHYEGAAVPKTAAPGAGDVVARADAQQQLVRIVMALDEPARSTLLLRFFDGLPPREVAARMGVPVETVRTRARRALQKVRTQLEEERGGRRAAFAFLAPLLAEGPPPAGWESGAATGATAAAASVGATTTGALIMATATKKTALLAAAVLVLGAGAAVLVTQDPRAEERAADAGDVRSGAAQADGPARDRDRVHVASGANVVDDAGNRADDLATVPLSTIRVRRSDGSPAAEVAVLIDAAGTDVTRARTDSDGVAVTAQAEDDRIVLAAARGSAPIATVLPGGSAGIDIDLPTGASVSGVVRVDGRAPGEPLSLRLNVENRLVDEGSAPRSAWDQLSDDGFAPTTVPVMTDELGRFRVDGLPRGERAWIAPPRGYRMADPEARNVVMRTPAADVVMDVYRQPRVRGRVVQPDGAIVPNARLTLHWKDGFGSGSMRRSAAEDGRFDFPLPVRGLAEVTLRPSDPLTDASIVIDVPVDGGDLGDVVLPGNREVLVRVVDPAGQPVPGAVVRGTSGGPIHCAADGSARLTIPRGASEVTVVAPVFEPLVHEIPAGAAEPHQVTLRPGTRVIFDVRVPAALRDRLTVFVEADGPRLFTRGLPSGHLVVPGATSPGSGTESDFGDGRFMTRGAFSVGDTTDGRVTIDGVIPETPFIVSLVDDHGFVHTAREVRLPRGKVETITLGLDGRARSVSGVVLGAAGEPVASASVRFAADGERAIDVFQPQLVRTDAEGRFTIPGVFAGEWKLLVVADGFVPFAQVSATSVGATSVGATSAGATTVDTIRLVAARTVTLRVLNAAGEPVEPYSLRAELEAAWDGGIYLWEADEEPGDAWRLSGLPGGDAVEVIVTLETDAGNEHHRFTIDPNVATHDLVLGEPESLDRDESEGD